MFVDEGGQRCEDLLNALTETGISVREGTSLGYVMILFSILMQAWEMPGIDLQFFYLHTCINIYCDF